MSGPRASADQIASPNSPIARPRRSGGARSTVHVAPAVNTQPSPAPKREARHQQAGHAGGNEVQDARERREQRARRPPRCAARGRRRRARPTGRHSTAVKREGARDDPDGEVVGADRPLHVAGQHGQHGAEPEEGQQRGREHADERGARRALGHRAGAPLPRPGDDVGLHPAGQGRGRAAAHGRGTDSLD